MSLRAGAITVSDGCARGEREDVSGRILAETLQANGYEISMRGLVPDDVNQIVASLLSASDVCDVVFTTGGTGFAPRDITPEATRTVIERDAPGLAELLRWTGYQKLPRAVLSRGVAGIRGRCIFINLPGSGSGVRDGLDVLLPLLPHAIALLKDEPVDHTPVSGTPPQPSPSQGEGVMASPIREEEVTVAPLDREAVNLVPLLTKEESGEADADLPPLTVAVIETNLDDLSPEFYDVVLERLLIAGAVDVFWQPIQMKKNRPATLLTVLAPPDKTEECAQILFAETTTFGLRVTTAQRMVLQRHHVEVQTLYGLIRVKVGIWRGVETTASPEYEDVKASALAYDVPLKTVYAAAQYAYAQKP